MKDIFFIKLDKEVDEERLAVLEKTLEKKGISNVVIVPKDFEIIQSTNEGYRIFTKDDYMRYELSRIKANNISDKYIDNINRRWQKVSKGFNFIIGVGQRDELMFYSAEYFNENIIGDK